MYENYGIHCFVKSKKPEILAPAGSYEALEATLHFGADAVYFSGKNFSLRAGADNFSDEELKQAIALCKEKNKKAYIALNMFAHHHDLSALKNHIDFLVTISPDAFIVSDPGVLSLCKKHAPKVPIHLSTQANTTNGLSALFWVNQGVSRIVVARELTLLEIAKIREVLPENIELEAFVHGAMCVSYSGRCLLSSFSTQRGGNKGACVQNCRWEYEVREKSRSGDYLTLTEDDRGAYLLNSKDMNMIAYVKELVKAGIISFKIEGRAKAAYYVANVVNAYRRAVDLVFDKKKEVSCEIKNELVKSAHRKYHTGFYFEEPLGEGKKVKPEMQEYLSSLPVQTHQFVALVKEGKKGEAVIEQRNRFTVGEELEVLSPNDSWNKIIKIESMQDIDGNKIDVADKVQQQIKIATNVPLQKGDMLRKRIKT